MSGVYDYVVVGGGSSGCIVAAELARNSRDRVLLLEAGPRGEAHPETFRANGYKDAFNNDAIMRERFSVPQRGLGGARVFLGTGSVMGGSGAVNGMVYTRGARQDYDEWPTGWRWDDVAPHFSDLEARLQLHQRSPTQWTEACISAARACGFNHRADFNDGELGDAIGYEWMSYRGEERRSSYVAFLKEPGWGPNLTIVTGASVHRILFDDQRRVSAVEYNHDGALCTAKVRGEVILTAGALETPKLLMLSGIGPAQSLRQLGIPLVADVPAVGQNLHDHPNVPIFFRTGHRVDCYYPQLYSFYRTVQQAPLPPGQSDTCYVFWPAPSAMKEVTQRMLPTKLPAWMYRPWTKHATKRAVGAAFAVPGMQRAVDHLFGIIVILGKPQSRGSLRLVSANPEASAAIDPGYYDHPRDMDTMVEGVQVARRLAGAGDLWRWRTAELMPGKRVRQRRDLERWVQKNTLTTYHFAGTCRMGEDNAAVTDPQLRVRGVQGVRVADASVIPSTPVSALNAPSMLIGLRASRFIRG